jgi:hypothetical protein
MKSTPVALVVAGTPLAGQANGGSDKARLRVIWQGGQVAPFPPHADFVSMMFAAIKSRCVMQARCALATTSDACILHQFRFEDRDSIRSDRLPFSVEVRHTATSAILE